MKRLISFIVANIIVLSAWCQTSLFYNNGASVYMLPGSYMIVHNDSLHNYQGLIQTAGDLRVDGDIYNDAGARLTGGPVTATGLYDIGGSWVNSGTFTAYRDSVILNGPSNPGGVQLITGTQVSAFYDLILSGPAGSAKTQTINATVSNILDLRTDELATQQYEMLVLNTSPAAITQTNVSTGGWVSSLAGGDLARATNSTSAYIFPTGTPSALVPPETFYYRPVDFTPTSAAANIYGARLVDNPDSDSYLTSSFDDTLCKVNPYYYHRLYHSSGNTSSDITMYFDPATDGYWTDMAHWGTPRSNEWNYMGTSSEGSGYGFTSVEIPDWSRFTPDPFALAAKRFTVNAGPNQDVTIHTTVQLNATITTDPSNITSIVWAPDTFLDNSTIADPIFTAVQTTEYIIVVTDQAGCMARDTLTMTVLPDVLLIPTAFSPNGDGTNDLFRPLNPNLNTLVFRVFDRWGAMVYETDVIGDGWDGTYKGRKQDLGVYVWQAQYSLIGIKETFTSSGNVTLVR